MSTTHEPADPTGGGPFHPENLPPPDTHYPQSYPDATGKGDLHVPGAGLIGLAVLLISLSMLFVASMLAFVLVRRQLMSRPPYSWPPPEMPPLPASLWLSTLVILASSVTIQMALGAARRDDERVLRRQLLITLALGMLFLLLQGINWAEFFAELGHVKFEGLYMGGFFMLTGLHAAHVIGGLIPLAIVYRRAGLGRYSRNYHPGVRYVSVYWHFLDVVWLVMFWLIYF